MKTLIPLIIILPDDTPTHLCEQSVIRYYPGVFSLFVVPDKELPTELPNILSKIKHESFGVCTDKSIFYRKQDFSHWSVSLFPGEVFSFRYGLNTTLQDTKTHNFQPYLNRYKRENGVMSWNPLEHFPHQNYGYPTSLDGHVYCREFFLNVIRQFKWTSKSSLEIGLQKYRYNFRCMRSFTQSVMFNLLSDDIDFDKIDISKVNGCHHFNTDVY
jgi:hypothetical protein